MTTFATIPAEISALYVGYFGRAGDPDDPSVPGLQGQDFWQDQLLQNSINPGTGTNWVHIAASFSVQQEAIAKYAFLGSVSPSVSDIQTFVNQIYQNLFNRTADPAGLAFWTAQLQSRIGDPQAVGQFILDVISGAVGSDNTIITNKVIVAGYFTSHLASSGVPFDAAAAAEAASIVVATDATSASVTTQEASVDSFIAFQLDHAPVFVNSSTVASVPENISTATTVFTAKATDSDSGDAVTYTLTGADASKFNINATTGAITFKSSPDFETPNSAVSTNDYKVVVTATDKLGKAVNEGVLISVTDVNETPSLAGSTSASINENTFAVENFTVTDPDAGDTHSYVLTGADAALFKMNGDQLEFINAPDFENPTDAGKDNKYDVTVTAKDAAGLTSNSVDVTVDVKDVSGPLDAFRLTAGPDGSSGIPVTANYFNGQPALTGFALVETLDDSDFLVGIGPNPTIDFATVSGGPALVTPHLTGITNFLMEADSSVGPNTFVSFEDTVGTTNVDITRISGGQSAGVQDMSNEVTTLSVENTVLPVPNIVFDYRPGQAPNAVQLTLGTSGNAASGVVVNDLNIGVGAKAGGIANGTGIATLNLIANGTDVIGVPNGTLTDGLDATPTWLNITSNNANLTINSLVDTGLGRISVAGGGNVVFGEVGSGADPLGATGGFFLDASTASANITANLDRASGVNVNSLFQTGSGADNLFTTGNGGPTNGAPQFLGQISTGGGSDIVNLGAPQAGPDIADLGAGSTIDVGSADDVAGDTNTVTARDLLTNGGAIGNTSITGGAGVDNVNVRDMQSNNGLNGTSISTGDGSETINARDVFGDGGGGNVDASIDAGAGNDTINARNVSGNITGNTGADGIQLSGAVNNGGFVDGGDDNDTLGVTGNIDAGGTLQGGAGDDTINVGGVVSGAVYGDSGAGDANGNDLITVGGINGGVVIADGTDIIRVNGTIVGNAVQAAVQAGKDNDITWQQNGDGIAVTQDASGVAVIDGGSETDVLVFDHTSGGTMTMSNFANPAFPVIVGTEKIQVLSRTSGTFTGDFNAVDGSLSEIDLIAVNGSTQTSNISNIAGEKVSLNNNITTGSILPVENNDFNSVHGGSVTEALNVTRAVGGSAELNLEIAGDQAFTTTLNDTGNTFQTLALSITNTAANQTVNFDANDFPGSVSPTPATTGSKITGSAAGRTVTLNGLGSQLIDASTMAANIVLTLGARGDDVNPFDMDRKVLTGSGNDTVDARAALVDGGDGIKTLGDQFDFGGGDNLFIIGNSTDITPDRDEVFQLVRNANKLQVDGGTVGTPNKYFFGNDAFDAGIKDVFTTSHGANADGKSPFASAVSQFETGLGFNRDLAFHLGLQSNSTITDTNNNNITVDVTLDSNPTGFGQGTSQDGTADDDVVLNVANGGTKAFELTVKIDDDRPTWITTNAVASANAKSELQLTVGTNGIDKLTLQDNNADSNDNGVFNGGDGDNQAVTIVTADSWAQGGNALTIDGSAVDNFDSNVATGGLTIDGTAETATALIIKGSANTDNLLGGGGGDTLNGNAGNDILTGAGGADTITGDAGNDVLFGDAGNDNLDGGIGNDFLQGGAGGDTLKGGDGTDVFNYTNTTESNLAGGVATMDTIADFDFAVDGINVPVPITAVGNVVFNDQNTTQANLLATLISRAEIQAQFFINPNSAVFVEVDSAALDTSFGGTNGKTYFMLIEDGTTPGAFDANDIVIRFNDDASFSNLNQFGLHNFGPFGTGVSLAGGTVDLQATSDLGVSDTDNITSAANPLVFDVTYTGFDNNKDGDVADVGDATPTLTLYSDANNNGHLDWNETSWSVTLGAGTFDAPTSTVTNTASANIAEGTYTNVRLHSTVTGTNGVPVIADSPVLVGSGGTLVVDRTPPTVSITAVEQTGAPNTGGVNGTYGDGETSLVTITFSESTAGTFDPNTEVTATNGTFGAWTNVGGLNTTYTSTFTPSDAFDGTANISVAAGVATDTAGNNNTASNLIALDVDTVNPTVTITVDDDGNNGFPNDGKIGGGETATVTFVFSEAIDPATFLDNPLDITVDNGSLSNLTTLDNITWTATFTPNPGTVDGSGVIKLQTGSYSDLPGGNPGASGTSNNYQVDSVAPTTPNAPFVQNFLPDDDSGPNDNITNVNNPHIVDTALGGLDTNMLGGKVEFYVDGVLTVTDTLGAGDLVADIQQLGLTADGTYDVSVKAYDSFGNASAMSAITKVTIDKTAPDPAPSYSVYGAFNDHLVTIGSNFQDTGSTVSFDGSKVAYDDGTNSTTLNGSTISSTGVDFMDVAVAAARATILEGKAEFSDANFNDNIDFNAGYLKDLAQNTSAADTNVGLLGPIGLSGVAFGGVASVGGAGNDILNGTVLNDFLYGSDGNDTLVAGIGFDVVRGGLGGDAIDLGIDANIDLVIFETTSMVQNGINPLQVDTLATDFNGKDVITNFDSVLDTLDFSHFFGGIAGTYVNLGFTLNNDFGAGAPAIYQVNLNEAIAGKDFSGADFAEIFSAGGTTAFNTDWPTNFEDIVLVTGTDQTAILAVRDVINFTIVDQTEVKFIGVLTNVTDTLSQANFVNSGF